MGAVAVGRVEGVEPGKLTWWWILVGVLAVLAYAGRASGVPDDVLYQWDTAVFAAIVYAVVLGLLLLIARGDTGLFASGRRAPGRVRSDGRSSSSSSSS